jgi:hypothetical protein
MPPAAGGIIPPDPFPGWAAPDVGAGIDCNRGCAATREAR